MSGSSVISTSFNDKAAGQTVSAPAAVTPSQLMNGRLIPASATNAKIYGLG